MLHAVIALLYKFMIMKVLTFICMVFFFYSCTKSDFSLGPMGGFSFPNIILKPDSTNKVKADISGPISWQLSTVAFQTNFSRWKFPGDSTAINIYGQDTVLSIQIQLTNILTIGTYNFGTIIPGKKEATITCYISKNLYPNIYTNDKNVLSGTLSIDTITDHHIHGNFNATCFKGTQQLTITNGSFVGNY